MRITSMSATLGASLSLWASLGAALGGCTAKMESRTKVSSEQEGDAATRAVPGSMLDLSAIDPTVSPCDNFYQYACGNWVKNTVLPSDKPALYRSFDTLMDQNAELLKKLVEDYASGKSEPKNPYAKEIGDFYASCMDVGSIEKSSRSALQEEIARIDALSDKKFLAGSLARLHSIGVPAFLILGAEQDQKDATQVIGALAPKGLGLPEKDYYLNQDEGNKTLREQYVAHVSRMLVLTGLSKDQALKDALQILAIETRLAAQTLSETEKRQPENLYHVFSKEELLASAPQFDWNDYFKAASAPELKTLNVVEPKFLTEWNQFLSETSLSELKSYLKWQVAHHLASALSQEFRDEDFSFYKKTLTGQEEPEPRWKQCINSTEEALGHALGESYVAVAFQGDSKEKASRLTREIQAAFDANLESVSWMDPATRAQAKKKLQAIFNKIGFPNQWKKYEGLRISRDSYIKNRVNASGFLFKETLEMIGKPVDHSKWYMTPQTVNAYYDPSNNEIAFPAAILQPPFFSAAAPLAENFGGIGMVIGHEITHGFDDVGRKFDEYGNVKNWWTPEVESTFKERASCLVDQYSKYTVAGGVHLNGEMTLGENIADLGGLKLALAALKRARATQPSAHAPTEGSSYTDEQRFFVSYAQAWCIKATPEFEEHHAKTNVHSNPKYRVNGVVTNLPEFAEVFGCQVGGAMAPTNRCTLW